MNNASDGWTELTRPRKQLRHHEGVAVPPFFRYCVIAMKPSEALAAHRLELRQLVSRYNVARPRVYGSVLTGKDDEESDLDLLVDALPSTTLFTLAGLEQEAQQLLGVRVSVLTPKCLPLKFRDKVVQMAEPL